MAICFFIMITFNEVPDALHNVMQTQKQQGEMLQKIALMLEEQKQQPNAEPQNVWFDLQDLQNYLPEHPAAATIYGWVHQRAIPYNKNGKRLRFNKVEIDKWLNSGRRATHAELLADASKMLHRKNCNLL